MNQTKLQQIKQQYGVVGNCNQLNRALDVCLQVAPTDLSVLIIGESGVGKEVLPRIIHDNSLRKRGKYLAINCGSIPEGTIDSELFGHEKGSFTGAIGESDGYFGSADGGTLFLDEVGELPLATQARLLRVLETGEYIRVGGQSVRKTNVRIVAATNVNMRKAVSEGKFREDLYYRLNTIPVIMPPLRDRGNDILALFRLFALQMREKYRIPRIDLTDDAKRLLLKYKWPGNVRQLKNITEQMCVLAEDAMITAEQLLRYIPDDEETMALTARSKNGKDDSHSYETERQLLFNILYELQNNVSALSNEVHDLKKQVIALGGHPKSSAPVLALPAAPRQLTDHVETQTYSGLLSANDAQRMSSMLIDDAEAEEWSEVKEVSESTHHTTTTTPTPTESLNVHDNELEQIRKALARNGGNRKKAAEELGISDRTLYRRLRDYNLE